MVSKPISVTLLLKINIQVSLLIYMFQIAFTKHFYKLVGFRSSAEGWNLS